MYVEIFKRQYDFKRNKTLEVK